MSTGADGLLARWCEQHLGSAPVASLWETGHLSRVVALRLASGDEVVVKVRAWREALEGCAQAHRLAWAAGLPCAEPLVGPVPLRGLAASAERLLPGGRPGRRDDPWLVARSAEALAQLVEGLRTVAPASLEPAPAWAGWADPSAAPWPMPDEGPPLNDHPATAPLRRLAAALRERLAGAAGEVTAGHCDWYQGNLRWEDDGQLVAVDDWDSIAALPVAAHAGHAAASYLPPKETPAYGEPGAALDETAAFLDAYEVAAGRRFDADELEVAWAAGLWQRTFDAAKAAAGARADAAAVLLRDAGARARLAGLGSESWP